MLGWALPQSWVCCLLLGGKLLQAWSAPPETSRVVGDWGPQARPGRPRRVGDWAAGQQVGTDVAAALQASVSFLPSAHLGSPMPLHRCRSGPKQDFDVEGSPLPVLLFAGRSFAVFIPGCHPAPAISFSCACLPPLPHSSVLLDSLASPPRFPQFLCLLVLPHGLHITTVGPVQLPPSVSSPRRSALLVPSPSWHFFSPCSPSSLLFTPGCGGQDWGA